MTTGAGTTIVTQHFAETQGGYGSSTPLFKGKLLETHRAGQYKDAWDPNARAATCLAGLRMAPTTKRTRRGSPCLRIQHCLALTSPPCETWLHSKRSVTNPQPSLSPSRGGGGGDPRCLSLHLALPLLTSIRITDREVTGMKGLCESVKSCVPRAWGHCQTCPLHPKHMHPHLPLCRYSLPVSREKS